jgi:AraC family transcriptional regulator of adaptative response/methylated-DNA-[protein]-cysteine methyltransferase
MNIQFTIGQSQLGSLLIASTEKGICAVSLRESDEGAEDFLRSRFPKATIERNDAALKSMLDLVVARIAGRNLADSVPLDLQGTDFQREVWQQLLSIRRELPGGAARSACDVETCRNHRGHGRELQLSGGARHRRQSCGADAEQFAAWKRRGL